MPQGASQPSIFYYVDNFQVLQNEHVLLILREILTLLPLQNKDIVCLKWQFKVADGSYTFPGIPIEPGAGTKHQSSQRTSLISKRDGGSTFADKMGWDVWMRADVCTVYVTSHL